MYKLRSYKYNYNFFYFCLVLLCSLCINVIMSINIVST